MKKHYKLSLLVILVTFFQVKAYNLKTKNDSISIVKNHLKTNAANHSDLTAENVYQNYLKFIDPSGFIPSITSITEINSMNSVMKMKTGNIETSTIMLNYKSNDGKAVTVMKMANMNNRNVFNGESGFMEMSTVGRKMPLPENVINIYKESVGQTVLNDPPSADAIVEQTEFEGNQVYKVSYSLNMFSTKMNVQNFYDINNFKKIAAIIISNANGVNSKTVSTYKNYTNFNSFILPGDVISNVTTTSSNEALNSESQTVMHYNYKFNESFEHYANQSLKENVKSLGRLPKVDSSLMVIAANSIGETGSAIAATGSSSDSENIAQSLAGVEDLSGSEVFNSLNKREQSYQLILKTQASQGGEASGNYSAISSETVQSSSETERISKMDMESAGKLKYRRSSLYTLMLDDNTREHYDVIKDAFGNTELSEKFNNHNIGPYLVAAHGSGGEKDQAQLIEGYLNQEGVARNMVAKWFNRDEKGMFNMNLIAERGQYNASEIDLKIAQSSIRGKALLSDAGKELIGNTFVVVYDYKYTNKEERAKKRGGFLKTLSSAASFIPGAENVSTVASVAKIGSDIVGKGYFVRTTSYLYRLVWNDEVAQEFYENLWVDQHGYDEAKKEAFENSDLFKLEYVGNEVSRNNLQSTIFTSKSNEQLIEIATTKAVDKNIGKLQRTYEEFRVKTPLLSIDPLAAKIGLKEDIDKGDKFEVLEQLLNEDGTTSYERVGIIKVDSGHIWDNTYLADEANKEQEEQYTVFKGNAKKFASGMLIRQIN